MHKRIALGSSSKTRRGAGWTGKRPGDRRNLPFLGTSKYWPHQGERECARRRRQMNK